MKLKDYSNKILVTGSHRSGSTWLGHMLSIGADVDYIHEPMNLGLEQNAALNCPFKHTFEYVHDGTSEAQVQELDAYIEKCYKAHRRKSLLSKHSALIIKDPIAFHCAEWFAKYYGTKNVVLIRHPAAFVASLKVKNWGFNFNNYLKQSALMDDVLFPYRDEIAFFAANPQNIIEQGILMWNIFYYRTRIYEAYHKDWIFVKHEDLSARPHEELRKLYDQLGLNYDDKIKQQIEKAVNPSSETEFKRNSKDNIFSWKERLSEAEISLIRKKTDAISQIYYGPRDWNPDPKEITESESKILSRIKQAKSKGHPTKFKIENINEKSVSSPEIKLKGDNLTLSGWAIDEDANKPASSVVIQIGESYFEAFTGYPRADVAKFYKTKEIVLCGIQLSLAKNNLTPGPNEMKLYVFADGNKSYYEVSPNIKIIV